MREGTENVKTRTPKVRQLRPQRSRPTQSRLSKVFPLRPYTLASRNFTLTEWLNRQRLERNAPKKRSKMRSSVNSSFADDPLENFQIPEAIRKISKEIDQKSQDLEEQIREISDYSKKPIGNDPKETNSYVDRRERIVEEAATLLRTSRKVSDEERSKIPAGPEKNRLKRALKDLIDIDNTLLRERAALAADRMRLKYGIQNHPNSVRIGEAYLMAITDALPEPKGSVIDNPEGKRDKKDQDMFRNRLIKAYNVKGSETIETPDDFVGPLLWCPISEKEFAPSLVKAAHIVPWAIGEIQAAYLSGMKPGDGHEAIWSEKNGIMLHECFEKLLDDARMSIIPDPKDTTQFISVILDEELRRDERLCPATNTRYAEIHLKRLVFQEGMEARPGKRYLYVQTLLSLFRRRRSSISGWEKDRERVLTGKSWASPGDKWARRSIVQAIAAEFGDDCESLDKEEGLVDFADKQEPEEEKKMAVVVKYRCTTPEGTYSQEEVDEE